LIKQMKFRLSYAVPSPATNLVSVSHPATTTGGPVIYPLAPPKKASSVGQPSTPKTATKKL
jgi:hypothetical protein